MNLRDLGGLRLTAGGTAPAGVLTATGPNVPALLDRLRALGQSLPGGPQAWAQAHGATTENIRRWRSRVAYAGPAR